VQRCCLSMVVAYVMFFSSSGVLGQTLVGLDEEETNAIIRQVHVDYLPLAQAGPDGNLQLTVDQKQSFKIVKAGTSDRYVIAITYVPKRSEIEDIENQCEIVIYSEQRHFVSSILSVGLSSYGICEGFDAIGFVRDKRNAVTGIGVMVDMAYGPSATERKTPFFIRWPKNSSTLVMDEETSRKLQNIKGLDSLYGIKKALR
jgi:hypothetical protein